MNNWKEIPLKGYASISSALDTLFEKDTSFLETSIGVELKEYLSGPKPNRMVFYIGYGNATGLTSSDTNINTSMIFLPDDWWNHGTNKYVYLFALASNSAKYLDTSLISNYFKGALGIDDSFYFEKLDYTPGINKYWKKFFKKLRKVFCSHGELDSETIESIQKLYFKRMNKIIKPSILHRLFSKNNSCDYISFVCLGQQAVFLKKIDGNQ